MLRVILQVVKEHGGNRPRSGAKFHQPPTLHLRLVGREEDK